MNVHFKLVIALSKAVIFVRDLAGQIASVLFRAGKATPKRSIMCYRVEDLGNTVSDNLETEINDVGNESIIPTKWSPSKNPEQQVLGEPLSEQHSMCSSPQTAGMQCILTRRGHIQCILPD